MKNGAMLFAGCLALALSSSAGHAQELKQGNLSGTIVSATAQVGLCDYEPDGLTLNCPAVDLYTTPREGGRFFVLTQACGQLITGKTIGTLAGGGLFCTTYEPGLAIPPGEGLQCKSNSCCASGSTQTQPCTITGILTRKD